MRNSLLARARQRHGRHAVHGGHLLDRGAHQDPGRWLLDNLASLPLVFPGLVLGLAIMICYLYVDIGIYGTIWIMLIAYVTRFMPYGMRYTRPRCCRSTRSSRSRRP